MAAALLGAVLAAMCVGPTSAVAASFGLPVTLPAAAPPSASPPAAPGDLSRLTAELAAVTAHAQRVGLQLDAAAADDGGLRVALERAQSDHEKAQWRLDSRARTVYMAQQVDPLGSWQVDLAQPDLRALAQRGQLAGLQVDRSLVDDVSGRQASLRGLRVQAATFRHRLLTQATAVLADQDLARGLLAKASALADAQKDTEVQGQLTRQRAVLDLVSAATTTALTPAQTARTRAAAGSQAAVEALLEATGAGIPVGYALSGRTFSGTASWYGPGFVGRPTASGAPYDPEKLTCANKLVPLGTVLHVSANGHSVNCLVNDRGPYVGDRVLDMSRAGSRALGYDGLAEVVVQVLLPV